MDKGPRDKEEMVRYTILEVEDKGLLFRAVEQKPQLMKIVVSKIADDGAPTDTTEKVEAEAYVWSTAVGESPIHIAGFTKPRDGKVVTFEGDFDISGRPDKSIVTAS